LQGFVKAKAERLNQIDGIVQKSSYIINACLATARYQPITFEGKHTLIEKQAE
jgi:hypothetical protein